MAACDGDYESVKWLVDHGADLKKISILKFVKVLTEDSSSGHSKVMKYIITECGDHFMSEIIANERFLAIHDSKVPHQLIFSNPNPQIGIPIPNINLF